MTRRAEVWKGRYSDSWRVSHWPSGAITHRHLPIGKRPVGNLDPRKYPTWRDAMDAALAATGQSTGSTDEKETP